MALHDVAAWLGHANVLTTTKYLATNAARQLQTLRRFEDAHNTRSKSVNAEVSTDGGSLAGPNADVANQS